MSTPPWRRETCSSSSDWWEPDNQLAEAESNKDARAPIRPMHPSAKSWPKSFVLPVLRNPHWKLDDLAYYKLHARFNRAVPCPPVESSSSGQSTSDNLGAVIQIAGRTVLELQMRDIRRRFKSWGLQGIWNAKTKTFRGAFEDAEFEAHEEWWYDEIERRTSCCDAITQTDDPVASCCDAITQTDTVTTQVSPHLRAEIIEVIQRAQSRSAHSSSSSSRSSSSSSRSSSRSRSRKSRSRKSRSRSRTRKRSPSPSKEHCSKPRWRFGSPLRFRSRVPQTPPENGTRIRSRVPQTPPEKCTRINRTDNDNENGSRSSNDAVNPIEEPVLSSVTSPVDSS